jgi:protein SCO1/2
MEMAPSVQPADVKLLNLPVLDQTGTALNFVDDVVGDKIVVFDFIFTSCTTICPVTTTLLTRSRADLQDVAPDRLQFVSLSIDSNNDDPERLARFAAQRSADWVFLTGEKRTMDELLVALDAYTTNPEDHAPMIIIGDAATGTFSRHFGMPNPDMVTRRVRELLQARAAQHDHHAGH